MPSASKEFRDEIRPMIKLYVLISVARRYGRCRISSSVRGLMSKGNASPQAAAQCEISAETHLNRGRVITDLGAATHPFSKPY